MKRLTIGLAVLVAAIASGWLPAAAADPTPTAIAVGSEPPVKEGLPPSLTARLTSGKGSALGDQTVLFYLEVELAGSRLAFLDKATTDATGVARIQMTPERPQYRVVARFEGSPAYAKSEGRAEITFSVVTVRPPAAEPLLSAFKKVMPKVIAVTVALVWVLLIGLAVTTVRAIRRHATA